jgi:gamma-glutamylcyclotransferase (GGCT)/AIG2-like uncharacterized protein YtfP
MTMLYFAYGSNMYTARLRDRVTSARPLRPARLLNHTLRFHKRSTDGSGKADAYFTGNPEDVIWGVVFDFEEYEKPDLDAHEGLGSGYDTQEVTIIDRDGAQHRAYMYVASDSYIDPELRPNARYKQYVTDGAREHGLPDEYVAHIEAVQTMDDPQSGASFQTEIVPTS